MWVTARNSESNDIVWLNLSLARAIIRTHGGVRSKTIIRFDFQDQITIHETPEQLFDALRVAAKKRTALKISDPRNPDEVASGLGRTSQEA